MPRHTAEQYEVIAAAVLDDGHTVAEVIEAAARGEFGVAPFSMSAAVADRIVAEEREQRRPVHEVAEEGTRRLLALCDRELSRLESLTEFDADYAQVAFQVAGMVREARLLSDDLTAAAHG